MSSILDASALLALLHGEPGEHQVARVLDGALISAVNWAEVVQKALARQVDITAMRRGLDDLGLHIEPFTAVQAEHAARLRELTRRSGLSLADRACLALATQKQISVLTADRAWLGLDLGIEILVIR